MDDLKRQLELLRARVRRIELHYEAGEPSHPTPLLDGREVERPEGKHWQTDRIWPGHHRHGSSDVGALVEMPPDLLAVLESAGSGEDAAVAPVGKWAFLDTETTGLAGGSGTMAFLVGVGWVSHRGFELRQYVVRDHGEEPSMLAALAEHLCEFDIVVTYNGKAYDQPLLETRYTLARQKTPFSRLRHVDLLFAARRLWKLRLERCRLQDLESRILGFERVDDVGGALIPQRYFEYLRTRDAAFLRGVLEHNAFDILSLACVAAVLPVAFREPARVRHAAELVGLARWLRNEGRLDESADLFRQALSQPLPDSIVWETLWHAAELDRKLGRTAEAITHYTELASAANPRQAAAFERLAIHYERCEKNIAMALEMTRGALQLESTDSLRKRESRLAERLNRPKSGRLL